MKSKKKIQNKAIALPSTHFYCQVANGEVNQNQLGKVPPLPTEIP